MKEEDFMMQPVKNKGQEKGPKTSKFAKLEAKRHRRVRLCRIEEDKQTD